MIKLSHSAATKYVDCPKSYQYHYLKKYRSTVQSSALLFGTSIDKAAEHYAQTKNFDEALEVFNSTWQTQEINGKATDLRFLLDFTYSEKDLDTDLLKKEDWEALEKDTKIKSEHEKLSTEDALNEVLDNKSELGYKDLSHEDKEIYNYANWLCLKRKGRLMLKEFKRVFDENVEEVLGTQVKIELEDSDKNQVTGFIDLVVRWKGKSKPVILDLKTAGREYDDDAVQKSPQLSLYVFSASSKYENTRECGFIVLNKNINKNKHKKCVKCSHDGTGERFKTCNNVVDGVRCNGEWKTTIYPKAHSQILIEEINEVLTENVVENFNEVAKGIKAEVFPRNFSNCLKYGSVKCPFHNLCHKGTMDEIVCKEKE